MTIHNPLFLQPLGYSAKEMRSWMEIMSGAKEGVIEHGGLLVAPVGGASYDVTVQPGHCIVKGDTNAGQGFYGNWSDAVATKTHSPDGTNPKIDRIVYKVNDATEVGSGGSNGSIDIVPGTPTSGANLTNNNGVATLGSLISAIPLARVLVPTAGGVSSVADDRVVITPVSEDFGLDAAKPTAAVFGRRWYATDTGLEYMDTGSTWIAINNSRKRVVTIARHFMNLPGGGGAGFTSTAPGATQPFATNAFITLVPIWSLVKITAAELAPAGLVPSLTLRVRALTNDVAPGVNIDVALFKVTAAVAGISGNTSEGRMNASGLTAVAGTGATILPGATALSNWVTSAAFALPSDGDYFIGFWQAGATAVNSCTDIEVELNVTY